MKPKMIFMTMILITIIFHPTNMDDIKPVFVTCGDMSEA